jgi:hypothetical protein
MGRSDRDAERDLIRDAIAGRRLDDEADELDQPPTRKPCTRCHVVSLHVGDTCRECARSLWSRNV